MCPASRYREIIEVLCAKKHILSLVEGMLGPGQIPIKPLRRRYWSGDASNCCATRLAAKPATTHEKLCPPCSVEKLEYPRLWGREIVREDIIIIHCTAAEGWHGHRVVTSAQLMERINQCKEDLCSSAKLELLAEWWNQLTSQVRLDAKF